MKSPELRERQRILTITRIAYTRGIEGKWWYLQERERQLRLCAKVRAGKALEPTD